MTTAALLQATSIVASTTVPAAFTMGGAPGGVFDATPTTTIVSVFNMASVGAPVWITEFAARYDAALNALGVGTPALVGETIVLTIVSGALTSPGLGTLVLFTTVGSGFKSGDLAASSFGNAFFITDAQGLPEPPAVVQLILVRFVSGPKAGVIPVEIVAESNPNVLEVRLASPPYGGHNYMPIKEDPTDPDRKKVHFS